MKKRNINEKRLLSFAIALTMCLTAISLTSLADDTITPDIGVIYFQSRASRNLESKGTILEYDDGSPAYYWQIPNANGIDYYSERMTMPFDGTLDTVYIMSYLAGCTDVTGEGIDVIIYADDGTGLPGTQLGTVNVPYASILDGAWTTVDVSSLGLSFLNGDDFHVGWTTANQGAGNIMCLLSDDGVSGPINQRSCAYYSSAWYLMYTLFGTDYDWVIAAEVSSSGVPPEGDCDYTVMLYDSYGDGWNGNVIDIYRDGVLHPDLMGLTLSIGSGPEVITVPVDDGATIFIDYQAIGSWQEENSYEIYDAVGTLVDTIVVDDYYPTYDDADWTGTADCPTQEWPDCKMHFPQLPDPTGWDVFAMMPENILADDFLCIESGPITDLHFWGSWYADDIPYEPFYGAPYGFHISIHADIPDPDEEGPLYSMPGELLWERDVMFPEFICTPEEPGLQGWFEPPDYYEEFNHEQYFRYDILFTEPYFYQEEGTIYWVDIAPYTDGYTWWGWKTSLDHFNDDAVYSMVGGGPETLIDEDFDAYTPQVPVFPPTGWTVQTSSSPSWYQTTGFQARCSRVSYQASDEWLISNSCDFSAYSTVYLQEYMYFYNSTSDSPSAAHFYIFGSIDDGATWTQTIAHYTNSGTTSGTFTYDISSWAAGQSNVKIAWQFVCAASTGTAYDYVYIDTVTLGIPALIFPPPGWNVYNPTGGNTWVSYSTYPHTGTYCSRCSYQTPNDDWLVSKPIVMPSTPVNFELWLAAYTSGTEVASIYYSTTGNTITDFTTTGTLLWTGNPPTDAPTYTQYSFSIPESAGTTVWFALSNTGNNQWYIYTDDWVFPDGTTEGFEAGTEVIYYQENFDQVIPSSGWPPAGWTWYVVSGTDTDNKWKINDTSPQGPPHSGTYMAEYDCLIISSGNSARLLTPALNFGGTGNSLSFWMFHDDDYSTYNDKVVIQVSPDGVTWTDITEYLTYSPTEGWANHVVDLSAYDGQPTIYVGFLGVSYYGYNNVYIDDVLITNTGGGGGGWGELIDPIYEWSIDLAFVITGQPVDNPPVACFTWVDPDGSGPGTSIDFDASCSTDDYGILYYDWDFDADGIYDLSGMTVSYDYGDTLPHVVTLRVTDTAGQIDTDTQTVQASAGADNPPVACYTWADADGTGAGTQIDFDASCSTDDYGITIYEWDWESDGTYDATGVTQSYDYGDTAYHNVTLRVTDTATQTDTDTQPVQAQAYTEVLDIEQAIYDRGFPIRHTSDGDWGGAQNYTSTYDIVTKVEIYGRKMGTPEFDLTVELREDGPDDLTGTLLDTVVIPAGSIPESYGWITVDFADAGVGMGSDVFIVCPPAPSGVTTSFGYEWGYAMGNQYDGGSFWFTRDGGNWWRDLPTMYEFTFRTYGMGQGMDLPPTACFTWADADGNGDGTLLNFDASCSSDAKSVISYEWDWDNDGAYDDTGVTQSHDYGDELEHTVVLRVTDDIAQTDTVSKVVKASTELICGDIYYHSGTTDNSIMWNDYTPWICAIELTDPELADYRGGILSEVTMCIGDDEYGYETSDYNIYYVTGSLPDITTLTPIASGTGTGWTTVIGLSETIPTTGSVFVIVEYHDYTQYPAGMDDTNYDARGDWVLYHDTTDDWQHMSDLGYYYVWGITATVCEP